MRLGGMPHLVEAAYSFNGLGSCIDSQYGVRFLTAGVGALVHGASDCPVSLILAGAW